jgi:hypothetical protein
MNEWRRLCGEIRLVIPARRASPFHGPVGGVAVHPSPGDNEEDRPGGPFADVEIEGSSGAWREWDGGLLAALAHHPERAMTTVDVQVVDVGAERFADA